MLAPPLPRVQLSDVLPQVDRLPFEGEPLYRASVRQKPLVLLDAALKSVVLVILKLIYRLWNEPHLQPLNGLCLPLDKACELLVSTVGRDVRRKHGEIVLESSIEWAA